MSRRTAIPVGLCLLMFLAAVIGCEDSEPVQEEAATHLENIALNKTYTLSVAPSYPLCTDPGDMTDLADGIRTGTWSNKKTVGWKYAKGIVFITVDLGKVEPIMGVAFSTVAGSASVSWPSSIAVLVSEDNDKFYLVGDLMRLADEHFPPAYQGVEIFDFRTTKLKTKARYVRFAVISPGTYTFCDEIEVYRGEESFLALDLPAQPTNESQLVAKERLTELGCYTRIRRDAESIYKIVQDSQCIYNIKRRVLRQLDQILFELNYVQFPQDMDTFKAIVPINDFHRKIFRIYAGFMADTGAAPLTVWHSHPYRMMGLFEQPGEDFTRLQVTMTQNERRPEVFNITNMGQEAEEVELEISHLIGDTRIYQVEYIDTREGEVVASALIPLKQQGGIYKTSVPAGMTRQIWLSIDSGSTNPGTYDSRIGIRTKSLYKVIKLEVDVIATHSSNYSDCSMVMWDYVYNKKYGITANNQIAAMEDIKSRPVDTVCCVRSTLPIPKRKDVDRDGNLTAELDFTRWDSFLEMFPGKSYLGYVSCKRLASFAGQKFGTAGFERILSQWAAAWANHNRSIGLRPKQVTILFTDEPKDEDGFKTTYAYAKAFKSGSTDISILANPASSPMGIAYGLECMDAVDIISVRRLDYVKASKKLKEFYKGYRSKGKELWLKMANGPTRMFNPGYYRLQPWYCLAIGATGSCFWSYGDNGKVSNWNEYPAVGWDSHTPVYVGPRNIATSKHWEATCEGIYDYRYLQILRNQVAQLKEAGYQSSEFAEAERMANTIAEEVIGQLHRRFGIYYDVKLSKNPSVIADDARLRILAMLKKLEGLTKDASYPGTSPNR